jgi:hypothetical protein
LAPPYIIFLNHFSLLLLPFLTHVCLFPPFPLQTPAIRGKEENFKFECV